MMEAGSFSSSIEKAITTSTFCRGDWPSDQWWTLFGDSQLNEIIEIAIRDSPDLMSAASRLKAFIKVAKREKSSFFPKVEGSFQVLDRHLSRNELPRLLPSILPCSFNQIQLDLNFNYEIDFFGKNRQAYLAALGLTKVEMAEMCQSHLIVTISLAQSYIYYATSFKKLALINTVVRDRKRPFVN